MVKFYNKIKQYYFEKSETISRHVIDIIICPIRIDAKQINILQILYGIRAVFNNDG